MPNCSFPRLMALMLALLLLTPLFAACSSAKPIEGTEEELAVIGTCADTDVLYEELRLVTLTYQAILAEKYGDDIWSDPAKAEEHRQELEEFVYGNLTANYAVISLCNEYNISYEDKEITEAVQKQIEDTVKQLGGMTAYKSFLEENNLTDHFLRFSYAVSLCENELYLTMTQNTSLIDTSDESINAFLHSDAVIRTLHVFVSQDSGESVEDNRAKAEEALNAIKNDNLAFNTAIGRYSEDYHMTTTDGYYFSRGEMIEPYEEAAFALAVDEVSDIVETELGFFIIKRLPKDEAYMTTHFETLKTQCAAAMFNQIVSARQAELSIALNEYGAGIDLTKIS